MKKNTITEIIDTLMVWDLEGYLNDVVNDFHKYKENNPQYMSFAIEWEPGWESDTGEFVVRGKRLETNKEFETRKEDERKTKEVDNRKAKKANKRYFPICIYKSESYYYMLIL